MIVLRTQNWLYSLQMVISIFSFNWKTEEIMSYPGEHTFLYRDERKSEAKLTDSLCCKNFLGILFFQWPLAPEKRNLISFILLTPVCFLSFQAGSLIVVYCTWGTCSFPKHGNKMSCIYLPYSSVYESMWAVQGGISGSWCFEGKIYSCV